MAAIDIVSSNPTCSRCGTDFKRRKGFFAQSYAPMYKGVGFLPICNNCIKILFTSYIHDCMNEKDAVRQMCRKLDLYWDEDIYNQVSKRSTQENLIFKYIAKTNATNYLGRCYDDTLAYENSLWNFGQAGIPQAETVVQVEKEYQEEQCDEEDDEIMTLSDDNLEITEDIIRFWGSGYPKSMYKKLEQRRRYWMSRWADGSDLDVGAEALIRQICSLELDINRDRMDGKPIEKSVNALNNLLGSINLKPSQKKDEDLEASIVSTPLGVWLYRYEQERPLPEIDDDCKDVNGIRKYVFTWMGHLCKMMGKKNDYSKLYEEEIERLRVEMPEYNDEEDDATFMMDIMEPGEGSQDE